jgi:WD40 repeat protein
MWFFLQTVVISFQHLKMAQYVNGISKVEQCCGNKLLLFQTTLISPRKSKKKSNEPVNKLCVSPDGSILASATFEIKLWDLSSHKVLKKFTGSHSAAISALKFSPDGKFLLSSSNDRFIYMWDCSIDADSKDTAIQGIFPLGNYPNVTSIYLRWGSFTYRIQWPFGIKRFLSLYSIF